MEKVEAVVIGAGVIGLAVARSLASAAGKEVLILERDNAFGASTSSRNSGVVHGGLYYPTGSYKATFCVQGRTLLYKYCQERNIFCEAIGKLLVASNEKQTQELKLLQEQCERNGYHDTRILSEEAAKTMEPNVRALGGALWSPDTGIVDSHSLMLHLLGDAQDHGSSIAFNTKVDDARINDDRIQLLADGIWISSACVVNCAGLHATEIALKLHLDTRWAPPKQYFAKGNYFQLQGVKPPFQHLIYPVPDEARGGLGIHATLDANSQVKFGPDVEWLPENIHPDDIDFQPNLRRENDFYDSIRSYWVDLPDGTLAADYAGVRPKLLHPNLHQKHNGKLPFQDFVLAGPQEHGITGLYHLLGIESPGLTSSLAIADHVAQELK